MIPGARITHQESYMKVVKLAIAVVLLASGVAQAAIYELTDVPYGRPSASIDIPPIVGYVNGWFELNGPIKSGMEVPAFDVTFDNDVRGRIDSAHTHFDNDTAFVTSTEKLHQRFYFINHAYDVGVVLSIGEDVEIDHGKVPAHVYGDGGTSPHTPISTRSIGICDSAPEHGRCYARARHLGVDDYRRAGGWLEAAQAITCAPIAIDAIQR